VSHVHTDAGINAIWYKARTSLLQPPFLNRPVHPLDQSPPNTLLNTRNPPQMASLFPFASEQITPIPSCVDPVSLHPPSSQGSLHSSYLGVHDMTNALDLSLPPNALRILAQGQASGRLPMPLNYHAGQPAGTAESVVAGMPTTMGWHSRPTMLGSVSTSESAYSLGALVAEPIKQSPETTLDQSRRVKVRARRAPRAGKSKARDIVSRGPAHTTSYRGDRTQSASLQAKPTSATHAASSQGEATPSTACAGSSNVTTPAMPPFRWATATAAEIAQRPGLGNLPVDLIDLVLPRLRRFVEEHEGSICSNSWAAGHGQDLPEKTPEVLRIARPAEASPQMEQAEPSSLMEQSELVFPMVEQSCGLDPPLATLPTYGVFDALVQQRNDNAEPEVIVEDPPSAVLQGLLNIDHTSIWGVEVGQLDSSLTPPTRDVIERSPWTGPEDLNSSSSFGYDVDLGSIGTEAFGQVDLGSLLDGWESFSEL